jgi:nitrogen-specific signal transduction histidine kinase
MNITSFTTGELDRLGRLHPSAPREALPQSAFDDIAALASAVCDMPMALILHFEGLKPTVKARHGHERPEEQELIDFCTHEQAMLRRGCLATGTGRDKALHTCACLPIQPHGSPALGALCVGDYQKKAISKVMQDALVRLANMAEGLHEREGERRELSVSQPDERHLQNKILAALTASGLDLIAYISPDYVYRYVNHRYLTYWGLREEDIIGHPVAALVGEALFATMVKPNLDSALAGNELSLEALVEFTGVGKRHVEVAYIPARDEHGALGVVVRCHDIDAIKQRKAQLRQALALLEHKSLEQERFIHIISHDLREPINTINNFASLLADDQTVALPPHGQKYLRFVREGGQRMAALLDDLLHLVRLEQHAIQWQPVDLSKIVDEVCSDLSAQIQRAGGTVERQSLPTVVGDPSLLRIAMQNLISNALKFSRKATSPLVQLSGHCDNDAACISVTDNGIGMPPERLDSIFEMFKRLHSSREYEGTGLGLSICRRIAELHGGSVSVTSTLGEGSCFAITLPMRQTGS